MKQLLIVYHSQSGNTQAMAHAVYAGATHPELKRINTRIVRAAQAGPEDLHRSDAIVFGTPENFGYMSGALKDFFDRTYYPCAGRLEGVPYGVFISAGNDGSGALTAVTRIVKGLSMREVQPPIIAKGAITQDVLMACETMGMTVAAGLEIGMY